MAIKPNTHVDTQCRGVDGSIFQNPAKMHLTVGMLVLLNNTEIVSRKEVLYLKVKLLKRWIKKLYSFLRGIGVCHSGVNFNIKAL